MVVVELVAKSTLNTNSVRWSAISPLAVDFNDKQEQADASRCLLLFKRPSLSHWTAQEGAGAMENLSGWSSQYRCARWPCSSNDCRQASLRHSFISVLETQEERRSAGRTMVDSCSNMVDGEEMDVVAEEELQDKVIDRGSRYGARPA
jgi:hypothetical protein